MTYIPTEADVLHDFNSPTADVLAEVAAERRRQQEAEGWTPEHDDTHDAGQMACAAACYAINSAVPLVGSVATARYWPWDMSWWKPTTPRRDLIKAAALLVAEIERLDRTAASQPETVA